MFGPAWTVLYGLIATASGRTLDRMPESQRRGYAVALGTNLVLNTGWTWLFFKAKRPRLALAEIVLLEASTIDLVRRSAQHDTLAGGLLVPVRRMGGLRDRADGGDRQEEPRPLIRSSGVAGGARPTRQGFQR